MELSEYDLTGWSVVLAYASILYLLMAILVLCLGVSYYLPICAIFSACGVCCGQCAHFALIIVTGVFRFSKSGEKCAEEDRRILPDEDTTW